MRSYKKKNGLERIGRNYHKPRKIYDLPREHKEPSYDTKQRVEIQDLIKKSLEEGKGRISILMMLVEKYPDSKLRPYFKQYIEHYSTTKEQRTIFQIMITKLFDQGKSQEDILKILEDKYPDANIRKYLEDEVRKRFDSREEGR